ncbi:DUF2381 family protein [Archangium sp.]|uniref:DUF2381 family protein n=1 Tax=Archangium sp. TaxID=1872627 RepID=UPI002D6CD45B|nr:DUF2381 family protein [Archangium sp.]HYO58613.1 DUF2381 family protein [Archangium sp.]
MESLRRAARPWLSLFLCVVTSSTGAPARETPLPSTPELRIRDIFLPAEKDGPAPDIYVDALHATVLRFEEPLLPVEVYIPDWKGRFEQPLAHGRSVLIVPLVKLHKHERIPLFVTLQDGTRVPFSLVASPAIPDQQVNVLLRSGSCTDIRHQLKLEQERSEALQQQIQDYERERSSPEHALAVLLSDERTEKLFKSASSETLDSAGLNIELRRFQLENLSAVLFIVRASDPGQPWILDKVEVTRAESGAPRPFASHSWPEPANSLGTRRIAVVMESSPKGNKEPTLVHLFERHGGRRFWYTSPKFF